MTGILAGLAQQADSFRRIGCVRAATCACAKLWPLRNNQPPTRLRVNNACMASNPLDEDGVFQDVRLEMQAACRTMPVLPPRTNFVCSRDTLALCDCGTNALITASCGDVWRGDQNIERATLSRANRRARGRKGDVTLTNEFSFGRWQPTRRVASRCGKKFRTVRAQQPRRFRRVA